MTTFSGAPGYDEDSVRIVADRGDHHAVLVVPSRWVSECHVEALGFAAQVLEVKLDELEAV